MDQNGSNNWDVEPLTPMGKLCLRPEHNHVIHCAIGFKNLIDIDALKQDISSFILPKIPRFSSLLVIDPHDGSQLWKQTLVNIDSHFIIHHHDDDDDDHDQHEGPMSDDDIINSYLADIAISSSMSLDKPLWELHIMPEHKCLIMRIHHALADGMSIMSMLWTMGRSNNHHHHHHGHGMIMSNMNGHNNDEHSNYKKSGTRGRRRSSMITRFWEVLLIWFGMVSGLKFIARCLWVKDKSKVISGIEGVELWPRKVVTARFSLAHMKTVKESIPNATIHDVLYGIVWCGLTRYLNARYPQVLQRGAKFTGMCPVNIREQPGLQDLSTMLSRNSKTPWGNKFSIILLPIIYHPKQCNMDPLTYVSRAKSVMDRKKQSMEAHFSYNFLNIASTLFGSKVPGILYYNLFSNTTFLLSNMAGPQEEISIANNPVDFIRVTSSSNPQAITMHMVSYVGRADLQVQVAKDIIHDPKFLAQCFEDALLEMKKATESVAK